MSEAFWFFVKFGATAVFFFVVGFIAYMVDDWAGLKRPTGDTPFYIKLAAFCIVAIFISVVGIIWTAI